MSKQNPMTIWVSTPDVIKTKGTHCRRPGGRRYSGFHLDLGDVPVVTHNQITGVFEKVVNTRGRAYGLRKALRYRGKKKN